MSVANLDEALDDALNEAVERQARSWVRVLFATHRRVAVRALDGTAGPEFCTCGDLWPCRSEELAARILEFPSEFGGDPRGGRPAEFSVDRPADLRADRPADRPAVVATDLPAGPPRPPAAA